jgi:hypothetical protein
MYAHSLKFFSGQFQFTPWLYFFNPASFPLFLLGVLCTRPHFKNLIFIKCRKNVGKNVGRKYIFRKMIPRTFRPRSSGKYFSQVSPPDLCCLPILFAHFILNTDPVRIRIRKTQILARIPQGGMDVDSSPRRGRAPAKKIKLGTKRLTDTHYSQGR